MFLIFGYFWVVSFWGESYRTRDNYVGFYGRYIHSYLGPFRPCWSWSRKTKIVFVIWVPGNLTISELETMANEFPIMY